MLVVGGSHSLCKSIRVMHSVRSSLNFLHTSKALNSDQLWPSGSCTTRTLSANIICPSSSLCIRFSFPEQYVGCEAASALSIHTHGTKARKYKSGVASAGCRFGVASESTKLISLGAEQFDLQLKLQILDSVSICSDLASCSAKLNFI